MRKNTTKNKQKWDPVGVWYKGLNSKQKKGFILGIIVFISLIAIIFGNSGSGSGNYNDACKCAEIFTAAKIGSTQNITNKPDGYYHCQKKYGGFYNANEKCANNK